MPDGGAEWLLTAAIFGAALLYSAVGHGGGSGYLAAMSLAAIAPAQMRPAALLLNVLVATLATLRFRSAFDRALFWPFALASAPLAFLGGSLTLPGPWYRSAVAAALIFSAWRLWSGAARAEADGAIVRRPPLGLALGAGALLGLLAGLTGVGGGIFLSPLLLLMRWGTARQVAAVSAPFILVNSLAGLLGHAQSGGALPAGMAPWLIAAAVGGWLGSGMGARRLGSTTLRRVLAVVLVVAGAKLALG